jgi:hypothetical protein
VYAAKQYKRRPGVHLDDVWRNESHADVYRTRSEGIVHVRGEQLDVLDAVESLAPQQVFGHILRRDADAGNLGKTNGRRFRGASWADILVPPKTLAAVAEESVASTRRRVCADCIVTSYCPAISLVLPTTQ